MKTQRLLVILASVCLMAFFNVLSFAQPDLARSLVEVLAQNLEVQGYDVHVHPDGDSVTIFTNRGELRLDLPATGEKLPDSGIQAYLVPQTDMLVEDSADTIEDLLQLQDCLNAGDLIYDVRLQLCELYVKDLGDFLCKAEAAFENILTTLSCIALYVPQQPPPTGDVVSVFVTSGQFDGNLGGLAGADAICQAEADKALLGGTWTAWLSDSTGNAIDRIPDGQYQLVDGTQVADDKADLTDGKLKTAIILTANGLPLPGQAWTGTNVNGVGTVNNCNSWTVDSSESVGDWGFAGDTSELWTLYPPPRQCNEPRRLYCFGGVE